METKIKERIEKITKRKMKNPGTMIVCSIPKGARAEHKKVTFVYLENGSPTYVAKTPKYSSKEDEFKKEFESYKKLYGKIKMGGFPKPYLTFDMDGFLFSLEEGVPGQRLVPQKNWGQHIRAFIEFFNQLSKKASTTYNKEIFSVLKEVLRKISPKLSKKETIVLERLIQESKNKQWINYLGDFGYGNIFFHKNKISFIDWEKNRAMPKHFPLLGFISAYFSYLKLKKDKRYSMDMVEILKNKGLKKMLVKNGIEIPELIDDYALSCLYSYKVYEGKDEKVMELQIKKLKKLISRFES